jgi:uncharacterized membrane protein
MKFYKTFGTITIIAFIVFLDSIILKPTNTPFLADLGLSVMFASLGVMAIYAIWKT